LKVVEHYILTIIQPSISRESDQNQFAYKKNRSTLDAIAYLQHIICSSLDYGCLNFNCVFLDFSSAFNTIRRQTILNKLSDLGTPNVIVRWMHNYFSGCSQFVSANGRSSSVIPNNYGVLQGAVLSPLLFSMYTDSLKSTNSNAIVKYADDTVIAGKVKCVSDSEGFQNSIQEICSWSSQNDLLLNKSKCLECRFHLQRRNLTSVFHRSVINDSAIEQVEHVKYLGVHFSSDCTWTTHVSCIFSKCLKLSFTIKRLLKLHVPYNVIKTFVHSCVFPTILYCSPVVFPGLLAKDFVILRRSVKIIARVSGIQYSDLINSLAEQHMDACQKLANRILSDNAHPLFPFISISLSSSSTRRNFNIIYARTANYRRSVVPALARILVNKEAEFQSFYDSLSGNST
jgi:hypothetical protein